MTLKKYLLQSRPTTIVAGLLSLSVIITSATVSAEELTVYSSRSEHLIKPFFDQYSEQTGVKIRYLIDKDGVLISRLKNEGKQTPADMLLTVDAGNLWYAADQDLLAPIDSEMLQSSIPAELRDWQNRWFALTIRARTMVYNKQQVRPSQLSTYADLATPKWRNKLCLRTSKKVYNQSLVAMLIAEKGYRQTAEIVSGWVRNLAMQPLAKDSQVIKAVARGGCAVGLVNTYYVAREIAKNPELADKVGVFFANQDGLGTHVNISGAGLVKHSNKQQQVKRLLEWLTSAEIQHKFASINQEYPVNSKTKVVSPLKEWGSFKQDDRPVYLSGQLQAEAVKLMDRQGYR